MVSSIHNQSHITPKSSIHGSKESLPKSYEQTDHHQNRKEFDAAYKGPSAVNESKLKKETADNQVASGSSLHKGMMNAAAKSDRVKTQEERIEELKKQVNIYKSENTISIEK